ncbi:putative nuclease HARBI1, partial [Tanacetum coccineum]
SSVEDEYLGVANAVAEICWIRNLLRELHTLLSSTTIVYCDNVSAVYLSSNPIQHRRTKHIEIDIHFVRDLVATRQVRVLHVPSRFQYADIFTKGLPSALFDEPLQLRGKHCIILQVRPDATGRMSLSVIMKCIAAIRQLAYGTTPDEFDEYLQMSERTARDCLFHFNKYIISLYMAEYLRKSTLEDVENTYNKQLTTHGFPGILGSIDCMHWEWKNCPVSWKVQYGAYNDINVLYNSMLFDDLLDDKSPVAPYVVNGVGFEKGYYLADDQKMAFFDWNDVYANPLRNMQRTWVERCETQRRKNKEIRDREMHLSLQRNLMEHIWQEVEHEDEDF